MGFVEDDSRIFRKNAAEIILFQGKIGEEEMVIDDDNVSFACSTLHRSQEALLELRALLPGAGVAARVDARPQFGIVGKKTELGAVAGFGKLGPVPNLAEG